MTVTNHMGTEQALPALFWHCVSVYEAMLDEARPINRMTHSDEDDEDEDSQIIVYEGFLTQLITGKLNLSVPYYTSTRKALMRMGCIRPLRRGGGSTPSQWELICEPTQEAFFSQQPRKSVSEKTTAADAVSQQIRTLSGRVSQLEDLVQGLIDAYGTEKGNA